MPQSVLIIDDSPEIHQLLSVRLQQEDVVIHHAYSAREGLEKAAQLMPDLLLLDVTMPDETGFFVCRQLKSDPRTAPLPVIFLTGATETVNKVMGFDLGAIDYVTKPFEPAELRARVRAALRTKRYQDMLSTRAQLDALTGLWNRAYFDRRLAEEVSAFRRYGRKVALLMIDLDHFKSLNDTCGHPFGDRALQATGEVLSAQIRPTDAACRYGGEEFAVIMSESGSVEGYALASRLCQKIAALSLMQKGKPVPVTASLGVASSEIFLKDPESITPQGLVVWADEALYRAKQGGRNRVCMAEWAPAQPAGAPAPAEGPAASS